MGWQNGHNPCTVAQIHHEKDDNIASCILQMADTFLFATALGPRRLTITANIIILLPILMSGPSRELPITPVFKVQFRNESIYERCHVWGQLFRPRSTDPSLPNLLSESADIGCGGQLATRHDFAGLSAQIGSGDHWPMPALISLWYISRCIKHGKRRDIFHLCVSHNRTTYNPI